MIHGFADQHGFFQASKAIYGSGSNNHTPLQSQDDTAVRAYVRMAGHTYARTHSHARTRTRAHARAHTHARTRTRAHARAHTHADG